MKVFRLTVLLFVISYSSLFSQVSIQIRVKQAITKKAKLLVYDNFNERIVDSTILSSPGFFEFQLDNNHLQGLYHFSLSNNIGFDFVVTDEPCISIETVVFAAEDSLSSINSKENELFFKFNQIKKKNNQQLWFLNSLKDFYSDTSNFRKNINIEIAKLNQNLNECIINLANSNPKLLSSKILMLSLNPSPPEIADHRKRTNFIIENWWNNVDLNDPRIINIPTFKAKIIDFIELLFDENLDKEEQDQVFINGVKTIFSLNGCPAIKSKIRRILFDVFYENDYQQAAKFTANYREISNLSTDSYIDSLFKLNVKPDAGDKAFDFKINCLKGEVSKLSSIKSKYKLIVFWSMWCPHCTEMIPELYDLYKNYSKDDFEVIAISIDSEKKEWEKYVNERKYSWVNGIEPDDGKSKTLKKYSIEATPELYLIDNELQIISCPQSVNQLKAKLRKLL